MSKLPDHLPVTSASKAPAHRMSERSSLVMFGYDAARLASVPAKMTSMAKMTYASEHHGQPKPIRRRDDVCIAYGPARLDDRGNAMPGCFLDAVGKRKERIG